MPFTFFSHQAPILPLKMALPRWVSGQALVLGSMAPDLQFLLTDRHQNGVGHTLEGQFYFCLPLTLCLTWIVSRLIARPAALHLPAMGAFHLHDYRVLAETTRRPFYWLIAVPSALIGSFSHIAWDSFTHYDGYAALKLGYGHTVFYLAGHQIGTVLALQFVSSLLGGIATLALMYLIGKRRLLLRWAKMLSPATRSTHIASPLSTPTLASHKALWLPALSGLLITLAIAWYQSSGYESSSPNTADGIHINYWIAVFYRLVAGGFIGLCIGSYLCSQQLSKRSPKT